MSDFVEAGSKSTRAKMFLRMALLVLLAFPACAGNPQRTSLERSRPAVARKASVQTSQAAAQPTPVASREARKRKEAAPNKPAPSTAMLVATQLKAAYAVSFIGKDSLNVRRLSTTADSKYSLFEQAILLGKIRSSLKRSLMESPAIASATTFQNGIVEIPFVATVLPYSAAGAVTQVLSIRGVNQINAHFTAPPAAGLRN
jgi:hypothetical protein